MMQVNDASCDLVPLRKWIEDEDEEQIPAKQSADFDEKRQRRDTILQMITIAYGIAELLRHERNHPSEDTPSPPLREWLRIENIAVRASESQGHCGRASDIKGVNILSPPRSVAIVEPSFLHRSLFVDNESREEQAGRYLEAEFSSSVDDTNEKIAAGSETEYAHCHALGILLHELFSQRSLSPVGVDNIVAEPAHKKKRPEHTDPGVQAVAESPMPVHALRKLGLPSSICYLIQNLLECGERNCPDTAYDSLDTVIKDLHLLLLDPNRFLFDQEPSPENGRVVQLSFREHKLYGRENEVSSITDAFCRVSAGKSEAFFIGGYSGSGKSELVNSLTARVAMADGYVVTHKFDQMSKERPLLGVMSTFNDLCRVIKERSSQQALDAIVKDLVEVFEMYFFVLAWLLPNARLLSPHFHLESSGDENHSGDHTNLRSICFTLQRFMRVVSSKSHPVMLFLDDIQWCDKSALAVVEGILSSDARGSTCLLFVGSYRSNEVQDDHALHPFMDSLKSSGVPTTSLSLEGLSPTDLNTMISDAMCMFPRICEPLSDIVFQKTKGNPFFVLAFLRSLVDGGLLEYRAEKGRWNWDVERVSSMDITTNVLYLLSSKMSGLSEKIQLALKVAACFGIKINEAAVDYLSTDPEYSGIQDGLEQALHEGFMIKAGADIKFAHDKVREAAYSLIPDNEKNSYHYSLGMTLYSSTKGKDVDDIIFSVADQINHSADNLPTQNLQLRIDLAKLNLKAGTKAVGCSDHATASSYFSTALSLLPTDHWTSNYHLSLRLSLLLAQSAYSSGNVEKARDILQKILSEGQSFEDKYDSYYLLVTVLITCGEVEEAYRTCGKVLTSLGEEVPHMLNPEHKLRLIKAALKSVKGNSEADFLEMKEMDKKRSICLMFYSLLARVSYLSSQEMYGFFVCRSVQLTMEYGVCKHSFEGLLQFSAVLCHSSMLVEEIDVAMQLGNAAMSCWKTRFYCPGQFPLLYRIYYGRVAFHTDGLQSCCDMLRQAFDAAMSLGDTDNAFSNSIEHAIISFHAGETLSTVLERTDYYLAKLHRNELARTYLSIFRDLVSTLIGSSASCISNNAIGENEMGLANTAIYSNRAIQAYWLVHAERCHHYFEKVLQSDRAIGGLADLMAKFFHGLNSFRVMKRQNTAKVRMISEDALATLKAAAAHSQWNFANKVHLLEAETFSFQGNNEKAKDSYAAAITSARSSGFVQEQGLGCELAGHHYKKIGDTESAKRFFEQAKRCYTAWGSQMKVDSITRRLESLEATVA